MVSSPTLMTEKQPLVLLEFNFEHREKLKLKSSSGSSGPSHFRCKREKCNFSFHYSFTNGVFLIETFMEENELLLAEN